MKIIHICMLLILLAACTSVTEPTAESSPRPIAEGILPSAIAESSPESTAEEVLPTATPEPQTVPPSPTSTPFPTATPSGPDIAVSVSAGSRHSCALTASGTVKCWGENNYGQLGDGTTLTQATAVTVRGLDTSVVDIAVGSIHSCALTSDGTVKCWGNGSYGQLGNGTAPRQPSPVTTVDLSDKMVALSVGASHTCVLTLDGVVKCWGRNDGGQLGDGSTKDRLTPVDVANLTQGAIAVSCGNRHTCAITSDGAVKCWGKNASGALGDGTTTDHLTPVDVVGLSGEVIAVSAGEDHTCALTSSGALQCWGGNGMGQLGDGTDTNRLTPVNVVGLSGQVVEVSAGNRHTCAVTSSGAAQCWGSNDYAELGDGGLGRCRRCFTPLDVSGLSSDVVSVSAGSTHTCAVMASGAMKCWGSNTSSQLGDGTLVQRLTPVNVIDFATEATAVSAGYDHTCAIASSGILKCWGANATLQLGDKTGIDRPAPVSVAAVSGEVESISTGVHTCAVLSSGGVTCWGVGSSSFPGEIAAVSDGNFHTCALTSAGVVQCAGSNKYGQLGNGTTPTTGSSTPVDVVELGSGNIAVATGSDHTCAVTLSGAAKCWGLNRFGQLGDGTKENRSTPVDVIGLQSGVVAVTARRERTCALTSSGAVMCWGTRSEPRGDGTFTSSPVPVAVVGLPSAATMISTGDDYTCALTRSDGAMCWGQNSDGQLGDGTNIARLTPVSVTGLVGDVISVSAGGSHACAVTSSGAVYCWGSDRSGQLGIGTILSHPTPVDVVGFGP